MLGANCNQEKPGAGLRQKPDGIHRQAAHDELCVGHRLDQRLEVGAPMGRECAFNILDDDDGWGPAFPDKLLYKFPKGPERSAAASSQPSAIPGDRQILTGERSPYQISYARKLIDRQLRNIPQIETGGHQGEI